MATMSESSLVFFLVAALFFFLPALLFFFPFFKEEDLNEKKTSLDFFFLSASPSPPPLDVASCLACGVTVMKKCFRAPGRVIFLCNESGFCQRKEPARSEDRRAVSFQERGPGRRAAPCARDPRSLRALIHSRLAGASPGALTSGEL